jgi:hypothetical protein
MDKQTARKQLKDLRDSISQVLDSKGSGVDHADAKEALKQTNQAAKQLKKSLLERIKEFPVVQKVSELGTAGTIAVSTAAVAQTELATDLTQVFVAEIAEDVKEERFEVPRFIDHYVDFDAVYSWGQEVIQEKVAEAQELASPPSQSKNETSEKPDPIPESVVVSDDEPDAEKESNTEEEDKSDKTEPDQEEKTEDEKEVQEESLEESKVEEPEEVKPELPRVETPEHDTTIVSPVS